MLTGPGFICILFIVKLLYVCINNCGALGSIATSQLQGYSMSKVSHVLPKSAFVSLNKYAPKRTGYTKLPLGVNECRNMCICIGPPSLGEVCRHFNYHTHVWAFPKQLKHTFG